MLAIRDQVSAHRPYRYRPQRLVTISLSVLPSTKDPRTPTGSLRARAATTAAPAAALAGSSRLDRTRTAFAARTAGGVPSVHASLNQPFAGGRHRWADRRLRRICVMPAETANSAAPYGPATQSGQG